MATITPFSNQTTLTTSYAMLATNTTASGSARVLNLTLSNTDGTTAADVNVALYSLGVALPGQLCPLNLTLSGLNGIGLTANGPIILAPGFGIYAKASANSRLSASVSGETIT